jgi:hypothetical protein
MSTVQQFIALVQAHGSTVLYHRDDAAIPCPCRTKQGFRDPIWHLQNPSEPVCNEAAMLPDSGTLAEFIVKAFVQPVQSGAVRRLTAEALQELFGEIESDDHIGLFPVEWQGKMLNFFDWSQATEDWIQYNGRIYTVVSVNLIPDPSDGNPAHHYEVGLRLVRGIT